MKHSVATSLALCNDSGLIHTILYILQQWMHSDSHWTVLDQQWCSQALVSLCPCLESWEASHRLIFLLHSCVLQEATPRVRCLWKLMFIPYYSQLCLTVLQEMTLLWWSIWWWTTLRIICPVIWLQEMWICKFVWVRSNFLTLQLFVDACKLPATAVKVIHTYIRKWDYTWTSAIWRKCVQLVPIISWLCAYFWMPCNTWDAMQLTCSISWLSL